MRARVQGFRAAEHFAAYLRLDKVPDSLWARVQGSPAAEHFVAYLHLNSAKARSFQQPRMNSLMPGSLRFLAQPTSGHSPD